MSPLEAGRAFWFRPVNMTLDKYFVGRHKLTSIDDNLYIGALSVYQTADVLISGVTYVKKNLFTHPIQVVAYERVSVKTRELKIPSKINLQKSFLNELQNTDEEVLESERKLLRKSTSNESLNVNPLFCFKSQLPIESKIVSRYGSYRSLPSGQTYFHVGLDLRARTGTAIHAFADGVVILAQKFVVPGNAVIIDHGFGVFSKYFHLNELSVEPLQKILQGSLIGKAGATGRVEAPHLHWEISWKGISVDPLKFMEFQQEVCKL